MIKTALTVLIFENTKDANYGAMVDFLCYVADCTTKYVAPLTANTKDGQKQSPCHIESNESIVEPHFRAILVVRRP
jgi:hypothetical protein